MSESFDPYRKWLGIPEGSRPPTHYQLLAISPGERDPDVINAAVVQRSAYVRNFQTGKFADDATRVLNEIAAAKACLVDAAKRAAYDAELKANEPPKPRPRPAGSYRAGALLNVGQPNAVLVRVRQSGVVQLAVNGRTVLAWRGTPGQLSHQDDWAKLRDRRKLFIGGHFGSKFHKLELLSRDPTAKPTPLLPHDEALATVRQAGGLVEPYQVQGQPALKVTMSGAGFTDEHFALLRSLPEVRQLYVGGSKITDAGLAHLAGLTSLEALGLEHTSISDLGLENLAGLDRVTAVNFGYTGITNEGLASLNGWTELTSLGLEGTAVDDTALPLLRKLPKLAGLIITGTRVTKAGARRWRSAMPKCNISGP